MTAEVEGVGVDMLFAAQPFTGLEIHALHVLRGLRQVGASVDVWVPDRVAPVIADAATGHNLVRFPSVPRPLRLGLEQVLVPWRFGTKPRGYRLLHSILGVAPLTLQTPLVLTVPDLTYRMSPSDLHPRARWYFGTLVPRSINRARRIMVSSQAVRSELIDLYHIAADKVACVPLCADPIFVPQPADQAASVRRHYHLPERYVLYVGTIEARKDLVRLRNAYDRLPPDLSDVALVFAGRTAHGSQPLARELFKAGRRGHVINLGYLPREVLPAVLAAATVFVYPSRYEGFGLPVLEAMSCGTPVIVSRCQALSELAGGAGVVLSTDGDEELTQAIERLLRFDAERLRLRELGLRRSAEFSVARLGRQTMQVYGEALAA